MVQVLAIGEVLWDVFPDGPRFGGDRRISPVRVPDWAGTRCVALASAVGRDELGMLPKSSFGLPASGRNF